MQKVTQKIEDVAWGNITEKMHQNGYAIIPGLLDTEQCEVLKADYYNPKLYRKTVVMARHRFGLGEQIFQLPPTRSDSDYQDKHLSASCTYCKCLVSCAEDRDSFPFRTFRDASAVPREWAAESNRLDPEVWERWIQYLASGFVWRRVFSHTDRSLPE